MLDRLQVLQLLPAALVFPVILAQVSLDETGRDCVHADAAGAELDGEGLRHHDERRFRHAVEHAVKLRSHAGDGGDVDDGAGTALYHSRSDQAREAEGGFQVDLDHFVELRIVHVDGRTLGDVGAGVIDHNIYTAEVAGGLVNESLQVFEAADVRGFGDDPADVFQLLSDGVEGVLFASADDYGSAFAREGFGDGFADASACAGDDGYFLIELGHFLSPLLGFFGRPIENRPQIENLPYIMFSSL